MARCILTSRWTTAWSLNLKSPCTTCAEIYPKRIRFLFHFMTRSDLLNAIRQIPRFVLEEISQEISFAYLPAARTSLQRVDGAAFSPEEAQRQLNLLGDFLTFCRGFWVSTSLTVGISTDGTVSMEELGTRKASPKKVSSNWLDFHHGNCMVDLFPKFVERMTDLSWQEALKHALYWYVRADTNLIGPDGGCFLLQAALERLAWHVLVRDRKSLSKNRFEKLSAADQLRLLLSATGIPLGIPTGLAELKKIGKVLTWNDGPQAFVGVRNRLVHPPKLNRNDIKLPYFETYTLGKWYVELILLSACGYIGKYSNRTNVHRWVGEVEDVPWVRRVP